MECCIEVRKRSRPTLFPVGLDDDIAEDNKIRVIDAFCDEFDLNELGFDQAEPAPQAGRASTGEPEAACRIVKSGRHNLTMLSCDRVRERAKRILGVDS